LTGEIDTSFAVQMYDIDLFDVLGQVIKLLAYFDWALNEQCFQFNECDLLLPFVEVGKAVFGVEYRGLLILFCPQANARDFDWLKKQVTLDARRIACR
jgi:hypothetical protein